MSKLKRSLERIEEESVDRFKAEICQNRLKTKC